MARLPRALAAASVLAFAVLAPLPRRGPAQRRHRRQRAPRDLAAADRQCPPLLLRRELVDGRVRPRRGGGDRHPHARRRRVRPDPRRLRHRRPVPPRGPVRGADQSVRRRAGPCGVHRLSRRVHRHRALCQHRFRAGGDRPRLWPAPRHSRRRAARHPDQHARRGRLHRLQQCPPRGEPLAPPALRRHRPHAVAAPRRHDRRDDHVRPHLPADRGGSSRSGRGPAPAARPVQGAFANIGAVLLARSSCLRSEMDAAIASLIADGSIARLLVSSGLGDVPATPGPR